MNRSSNLPSIYSIWLLLLCLTPTKLSIVVRSLQILSVRRLYMEVGDIIASMNKYLSNSFVTHVLLDWIVLISSNFRFVLGTSFFKKSSKFFFNKLTRYVCLSHHFMILSLPITLIIYKMSAYKTNRFN
jgi:hypothetical protein